MTDVERWADAFRRLAENPTQNASAVGAAIAIVVLAVVVIILIAIAMAMPSGRRVADSSESRNTHDSVQWLPPWALRLIAVLCVLLGLSGSIALWYASTSTNEYCTKSCHAMAEPAESWAISAHSDVRCVRCHEGRPWASLPRALTARGYSLYLEITGSRSRGETVPSANCMSCHANVIEKPLTARNGEVFLHGEVLTVEDDCVPCHGRQGHVPGRP